MKKLLTILIIQNIYLSYYKNPEEDPNIRREIQEHKVENPTNLRLWLGLGVFGVIGLGFIGYYNGWFSSSSNTGSSGNGSNPGQNPKPPIQPNPAQGGANTNGGASAGTGNGNPGQNTQPPIQPNPAQGGANTNGGAAAGTGNGNPGQNTQPPIKGNPAQGGGKAKGGAPAGSATAGPDNTKPAQKADKPDGNPQLKPYEKAINETILDYYKEFYQFFTDNSSFDDNGKLLDKEMPFTNIENHRSQKIIMNHRSNIEFRIKDIQTKDPHNNISKDQFILLQFNIQDINIIKMRISINGSTFFQITNNSNSFKYQISKIIMNEIGTPNLFQKLQDIIIDIYDAHKDTYKNSLIEKTEHGEELKTLTEEKELEDLNNKLKEFFKYILARLNNIQLLKIAPVFSYDEKLKYGKI